MRYLMFDLALRGGVIRDLAGLYMVSCTCLVGAVLLTCPRFVVPTFAYALGYLNISWGMPEPLLRSFLEMFVKNYSLIFQNLCSNFQFWL